MPMQRSVLSQFIVYGDFKRIARTGLDSGSRKLACQTESIAGGNNEKMIGHTINCYNAF
jgi:hypothetical protein